MGVDAGTPPGLWERVRSIAAEEVAKFMRSGFLRNASISDGGLTVKGGFIRLRSKAGDVDTWWVGPVLPKLPDGSNQPGMILRRNDGTAAMALFDPDPTVGGYNQFLAIYDREGHVVFSDDTNSGQGIARPWIGGAFSARRYDDFSYSTDSTDWVTLAEARVNKQQPKLEVSLRTSMDTDGAAGEVRVMVDGAQLGATTTEGFLVTTRYFGPELVAGEFGSDMDVQIQAHRTAGTGFIRVEPRFWRGRQS